MTSSIPLFEAKTHLSDLVRRISESGKSVVLTVRGKPMVRIVPLGDYQVEENAWEAREKVVARYGVPDYVEPVRRIEKTFNPFEDE